MKALSLRGALRGVLRGSLRGTETVKPGANVRAQWFFIFLSSSSKEEKEKKTLLKLQGKSETRWFLPLFPVFTLRSLKDE